MSHKMFNPYLKYKKEFSSGTNAKPINQFQKSVATYDLRSKIT